MGYTPGQNARTQPVTERIRQPLRSLSPNLIIHSRLFFDTANHNVTGTKRDWRHYQGQCEYFAVYCADLGQVYLVPVDQVGRTRAHLRIEPTKNNQEKNVRWAKDYKL